MINAEDLANADPALAATFRTALAAFLKERFPSLPVYGGPASNLILYPHGYCLAALQAAVDTQATAADVRAALDSGTDPDDLTQELAAIGFTRIPATPATGELTVVVETDTTFVISASAVFETSDGTRYSPVISYQFYPTGTTTTGADNEVVLTDTADDKFYGTIMLAAISTGESGNKAEGTTFEPTTTIVANAEYYASTAFTGGADAESAAELSERIGAAGQPQTAGSIEGVESVVVNALGSGVVVSVVGYSDGEMVRGISPLGVVTPGHTDAIVKNGPLEAVQVTKSALLVDTDGPYGIWRVTLTPSDVKAVAYVPYAYPANGRFGSTSYPVTITNRGVSTTDKLDWVDVQSGPDAAFSVYQTVVGEFTDPDTSLSGLTEGVSTKQYTFSVLTFPGVEAANDALIADSVRPSGGDIVAKGPTPVKVTATVGITASTSSGIDEDAIAQKVATTINDSSFGLTFSIGNLVTALASLIPSTATLETISLIGKVFYNNGTTDLFSSSSILSIDEDFSLGVGAKTLSFYCQPEDVAVNVTIS